MQYYPDLEILFQTIMTRFNSKTIEREEWTINFSLINFRQAFAIINYRVSLISHKQQMKLMSPSGHFGRSDEHNGNYSIRNVLTDSNIGKSRSFDFSLYVRHSNTSAHQSLGRSTSLFHFSFFASFISFSPSILDRTYHR